MTAQSAFSLDAIDATLAAAGPGLDPDEQRLAAAVLRLLSAGEPVSVPAVFWDGHDQVTGFWGLALAEMPHQIRHAGRDLYAWCAWDPLFLARVIGDLQVATADPVTGEAIAYCIGADGVLTGASHPDAVLSFLRPGQPWDGAVITTFCHYVWHFTGPATAQQWTTAHPGAFAIGLGDAAELAGRHAARVFGAGTQRDETA